MLMPRPDEGPPVETVSPSTARQLHARLAEEQAERRLPSLVAVLVRDGRLVWHGAVGEVDGRPPTADTQYRIGSITKTMVAVAVLRLRDEGLLGLNDPVGAELPEAPAADATIAQLLSHTSGLQAETHGPWWERTPGVDWSRLAASHRHDATPLPHGRRHHYSNVGYAVLGQLLAHLRGRPWDEVLHDELLGPLGMHRTTVRPVAPAAPGLAVHPFADAVLPEPEHDAVAMGPAGQLWCSIRDLGRWAAFLGGATAGLLSDASLEELGRPIAIDDRPGQAWTTAHGLGVQVHNFGGRRFIGHGGSMPGFLAAVRVDVASGDGAAVMTNTTTGLGPDLIIDLLDLLAAHDPRPAPTWRAGGIDPALLELAGVWYWGPTPLLLHVRAGEIEIGPMTGPGRSSRFRPAEHGTWRGLDAYYAGERLRVVRRDDGTVDHLDLGSFVLTRAPYDPDSDVPGGVEPGGWR
jgi:CubicO group peptidase (beta-lactamase class C family)